MLQSLTTFLTPIFISLTTLTGVALHDTKLDKLAVSTLAVPVVSAVTDSSMRSIASDPHTHVERVSLSELRSSSPRIAPRYGEQKRHLLQKSVPRGFHRFDHYALLYN